MPFELCSPTSEVSLLFSVTAMFLRVTENNNDTSLVGEQSSKGIDISIGAQATKAWSIQGNYTYVDAAYENYYQDGVSLAGKRPVGVPATVLNLWTTYAFTPDLKASMGIRRVGKIYGDAANTTTWPDYTLLDVGMRYQINRHVALVGHIRNVTDRMYAVNVDSTFKPTSVYLGAPRTADVALHISF